MQKNITEIENKIPVTGGLVTKTNFNANCKYGKWIRDTNSSAKKTYFNAKFVETQNIRPDNISFVSKTNFISETVEIENKTPILRVVFDR